MSNKKSIIRIGISALVIAFLVLIIYLLLRHFGVTNLKREQIQEWVSSTGVLAPLAFIFISFLQVTFIPIPGAVTILAGNYLFGAFFSFLYSYIGMMIGGIFAFFLGRVLGRPFVNWLAGGKEIADGWIKRLKGRETVFLFFAFLLPLFPDDLLCSVAGVLTMRYSTFIIMQVITRATSIGATILFMSGEIIPFHGWGLMVLSAVALICVIAFIFSMKYADKLNSWFDNLITKISNRFKKRRKTER